MASGDGWTKRTEWWSSAEPQAFAYQQRCSNVDAVMVLRAGEKPEKISLCQLAVERGLGPIAPEEIKILGDFQPIKGLRLPPVGLAAAVIQAATFVYPFLRRIPQLDRGWCIRCRECSRNCSVEAIELISCPVINHRKCVVCFCCCEICPVRAMTVASLPKSIFLRFTNL